MGTPISLLIQCVWAGARDCFPFICKTAPSSLQLHLHIIYIYTFMYIHASAHVYTYPYACMHTYRTFLTCSMTFQFHSNEVLLILPVMIQLHYTVAAQYKSRALMHQKEKFLFPISYLDILYYSSLKTRIKKNMADINIATSITAWCDPDWIIQSKNNHFFLIFITHIQDNKIKSIHVSALFMQILSSYFLIPHSF